MLASLPISRVIALSVLLFANQAWGGWQRDMVCQGSCGAGCGPCPTTGRTAPLRANYPSGPSAEDIAHSTAERLHQEGLAAYNNGDYTTALQLLNESHRLWPDTPNIDNDLNNVYGMIERHKSGARFADGVDDVKQRLLNEQNTSSSQGMGGLEFMPDDSTRPNPAHYLPSGNALIGGTGWLVGYNVPPGSRPELLARSQRILKRWAEAEGIPYDKKIDFTKYNFVLGIAASTDIFNDLASRVVFDEFSNGQHSAALQKSYNSLKGRQFDELACHSNGAMICLAALENNDTLAKHVVLFGPQITPESLAMWDQLVRSGRISTVQIYLNRGDPVPAASMLASNPTAALTAAIVPVLAAPLFNADVMAKAIAAFAPSVHVDVFACSDLITAACHDMKVYRDNTGACPASSGKIVPGTTLPGRGGLAEPPPPCR